MSKFFLTVSKITLLEVALTPILLCGAVASSNVATYYHNLMVLTAVCGVTSFISFLVAQIVD